MNPTVTAAFNAWQEAHERQQEAASAALAAAFQPLARTAPPTGCCDIRLEWNGDEGAGKVCVDTDSRVTVEFTGPQPVIGDAVDQLFGHGWFDFAPDGIAQAGPGTYDWLDEASNSELELAVDGNGAVGLSLDYATVPEAVALLDAVHTAYSDAGTELPPPTAPGR